PNPVVKFGPTSLKQCKGKNVIFFDSTAPAGTVYQWNFGDGSTSSGLPGKHTYTKTGTFEVQLKVINDKGCIDSAIRTITVYDNPKADFTATTACEGDPTYFTNNSTAGGGATFIWKFGDNQASSDKSPQHTYTLGPKTYAVRLKVISNAGGCS